jgi:hypothetical protein
VAERVTAALAAEIPLSGPVPSWATGTSNVSVLPSQREREQRRSRRNGRVLSAAAVVALVVGTVAVGTQFFADSNDSAPTSATSGGADAEAGQQRMSAPATLLTTSGATYTKDALATQVAGLVTTAEAPGAPLTALNTDGSSTGAPETSPEAATYSATDVVTDDAPRSACVTKLVEGIGELPIAIDAGNWMSAKASASPEDTDTTNGASTPAVVFVLAGEDPTRVEVYVVGPSCGDPVDLDAHLLYFALVPRP